MNLYGEELLHIGIILLAASLLAALLFTLYFLLSGKRLKKLEDEYGKKSR